MLFVLHYSCFDVVAVGEVQGAGIAEIKDYKQNTI